MGTRGISLGDLRLLDACKVLSSTTSPSPPPPPPPPPPKWDEKSGTAETKLGTVKRAGHCRGKARGPAVRFSEFCSEIPSEISLRAKTKGLHENNSGSDGPERDEYVFRVETTLDGDEGTTSLGEFLEGFHRGSDASEPGLPSATFGDGARFDPSEGCGERNVNASNGDSSFAGATGSREEMAATTVTSLRDDVGWVVPDDSSTMGDPQRRIATPSMPPILADASRDMLWRQSAPGGSTAGFAKSNGSIPGTGAIHRSNGYLGNHTPAVNVAARARNNIDRMVSSMLEDVLPASKGATTGGLEGVAGAVPRKAAVVGHHFSPPRVPLIGSQVGDSVPLSPTEPLPLPPQVTQVVETPRTPSPRRRSDSEGTGTQVRLFTPIEVLMHAPAGSEGCDLDRESQRQLPRRKATKGCLTRCDNRHSVVGAGAGGKQTCHGDGGRGSGRNTQRSRQTRVPAQTPVPSASGETKGGTTPGFSGFESRKPIGGVIEQSRGCSCGRASADTGADAPPKDAASKVVAEDDKADYEVKIVTPSREGGDSHELPRSFISIDGAQAAPSVVEFAAAKPTAAGSGWTNRVRETEGADAEGSERRSSAALLRVIQEQELRAKEVYR